MTLHSPEREIVADYLAHGGAVTRIAFGVSAAHLPVSIARARSWNARRSHLRAVDADAREPVLAGAIDIAIARAPVIWLHLRTAGPATAHALCLALKVKREAIVRGLEVLEHNARAARVERLWLAIGVRPAWHELTG